MSKEIELQVDKSHPWSLTEDDHKVLKELDLNFVEPTAEDLKRISDEYKDINSLEAYYYTMKNNLDKTFNDELNQINTAKTKDSSIKLHFYKMITSRFLVFLYGNEENNMDRYLPENGNIKSERTQKEFLDFTEESYKSLEKDLELIYKQDLRVFSLKGVETELKLKLTFEYYYNKLFNGNEINEQPKGEK